MNNYYIFFMNLVYANLLKKDLEINYILKFEQGLYVLKMRKEQK